VRRGRPGQPPGRGRPWPRKGGGVVRLWSHRVATSATCLAGAWVGRPCSGGLPALIHVDVGVPSRSARGDGAASSRLEPRPAGRARRDRGAADGSSSGRGSSRHLRHEDRRDHVRVAPHLVQVST